MAGHSKWAGIKHKKAIIDAKRGKIFTKIAREITVASRLGGPDPASNPRLRTAVLKGRGVSMPNDNIDRAIKKGSGDLDGVAYKEVSYEGYGAGGIAVMVEAMTDNINRTVPEIRSIFGKAGGQMGENGCVSWMFLRKGVIIVSRDEADEDSLMETALEAGAEDMTAEAEVYEIHTPADDLETVREALEAKGIKMESVEVSMIPQNTVAVDDIDQARKVMRLMDNLEDHDDVQNVWANFDIPDEIMEQIEGS
jgi:YebC/PmpR family DNA-binding regulatory protein